MKFWNKQPKVRERCWYRIDVNGSLNFHQMKRDLQKQPGGRFYIHMRSLWSFSPRSRTDFVNYVEFERHQDAVWFELSRAYHAHD